MSELVTIALMPVRSMSDPVANSDIVACQECLEPCWLSPSSRILADYAQLLCMACVERAAQKAQAAGEPLMFGGFIPGQLEELERDAAREKNT